jgi:hypothetical protein
MKLVDGESLRALIGRAPPASYDRLKELLEVFVKVCDALAFAHSRGVLHCDIKSANVMVGRYGQVYLMDWGGAQLLKPRPGVDTSNWVRDSLPTLPRERPGRGVRHALVHVARAGERRARADGRAQRHLLDGGAALRDHDGAAAVPARWRWRAIARRRWRRRPAGGAAAPVPARADPHRHDGDGERPEDRYQTVEDLQAAVSGLLSGGGNFPTIRVPAGEHVIREGEVGDAAYWIESGTFEVYQERDGVRKSLRVLTRNVFFGETAIFARTTRTASVVALTDGVLKVFTASALEGQLDSMTPWMRIADPDDGEVVRGARRTSPTASRARPAGSRRARSARGSCARRRGRDPPGSRLPGQHSW